MNMRMIAGALTLALLSPAALADEAGSVLFVRGDVVAERQPPVALERGDTIEEGDEIVTGDASRAQLDMLDGARIAIRPNSRIRIDEYAYTEPATATISTREDSSVMNLVKGGFRTITGAVGDESPENYEVRTAVGVLGIRGTDFSLVFCNGDCNWAPGASSTTPVPDGLYIGVTSGTIVFRTVTRTIELAAGEYAFIPLREDPVPERLDTPPAVILDQNDPGFDPSRDQGKPDAPGDARAPTGFDPNLGTRRAPDTSAPSPDDQPDSSRPSGAPTQGTGATDAQGNVIDITDGQFPEPPPPPPPPRSIANSGDNGASIDLPLVGVGDNDATQFLLDANGDLERTEIPFPGRTGTPTAIYEINSATNTDTGSDAMTFMRWGRWSGGTMTVTQVGGPVETVDLSQQSLHWIQSAEGAPPTMPITGVATYTLIGNTSPTDNQGNIGVLGAATFEADFINMLVTSSLNITIGGQTWIADGRGQPNGTIGAQAGLPAHLFSGFYNVSVDGIGGGSGDFAGFFSGPGPTSDPVYPGGVGLTYRLTDASGSTTVSGAAAFGNP